MNKAELIDVLTQKLGSDRRQATAAVENVVDTIVRAVHKGDSCHHYRVRCVRTASPRGARGSQPPYRRDGEGEADVRPGVPSGCSI